MQADANDAALPANVAPPGGGPIVIPAMYNINMQNAVGNYNEPSEHELIPALKVNLISPGDSVINKDMC